MELLVKFLEIEAQSGLNLTKMFGKDESTHNEKFRMETVGDSFVRIQKMLEELKIRLDTIAN